MKRLFALLCSCAVLLTLAACAGPETVSASAAPGSGDAAAADGAGPALSTPSSAPDPSESGPALELEAELAPQTEPESQTEPEPLPLQPLPDNVRWTVEPALEFTCIAPVTLARGDEEAYYNTCGLINPDGLSEVTIDGKYGLIDHDGQWAVPCEFDYIYCGREGKYALEKYSDPESGGESESYVYEPGTGLRKVEPDETNPDGSGVLVSITGTSMNPFLCYVPEKDEMQQWSNADVWPIYEASRKPDYPVRALYYVAEEYDKSNGTWLPDFDSDIFVLTDGKRPVSDERYQSIGCVAQGIVSARKSGGKWGYLDTEGNVVIPFEYDGASLYYETWDYETHTPLEKGVVLHGGPFQATEGTVVLRRGNSSALCTAAGEEIIPFGVFEELLPLHEGRLWAKYDGKWGVLALEEQ